jgi:hypothetical protein
MLVPRGIEASMASQCQIPSYETWLKGTYALGKPRSEELKVLDEAVRDYNKNIFGREGKLRALGNALTAWKQKEGPQWMNSARNRTGLLTQLDEFFSG